MTTGLYIRAKIAGQWQSVDIADERVSKADLLGWLRSRGGANRYAENVVGILLGRGPLHVEGKNGDSTARGQLEMFSCTEMRAPEPF